MRELTPEQQVAARAPLDQALVILAAAGTGKTTTILERICFMLEQSVPPGSILALTFSRKAQAELQARLEQRLRGGASGTAPAVATFHSWSWGMVRRHWREAGFPRQPTVVAGEEQMLALMQDCLMWDELSEVRRSACKWLFLEPPTASWAGIAATAAARHAQLYARCVHAACRAHADEAGGAPPVTPAHAAARPFEELPPRLQLLLAAELHSALASEIGRERGQLSARDRMAAAAKQAPFFLAHVEGEKRQGCMPDADAYAALCASLAAAGGDATEQAELRRRLARVGAAFQDELRRLGLAALSDLPPLAARLLRQGGGAAAAARAQWTHVLVDEMQDTGQALLDLLGLLLGPRRSVTAVGDDDQSIYSFLAAAPRVFADFRARFDARLLCLTANFRSTPAICTFASHLLAGNRRADKTMRPARRGACAPVSVTQHPSAAAEAEWLAAEVARLWLEERVPHSDVCVLLRCLRLQGGEPHGPLVQALRRRGIPYQLSSADRLGEDAGVAALTSYLALLADPACDPALEAVLRLPHHGLGQDVCSALKQERQAARLAGRTPPSAFECAERVCSPAASQQASQLNSEDVAELQWLVGLVRRLRQALGREPLPRAVLRAALESGLAEWLREQQGEQQQQQRGAPAVAAPEAEVAAALGQLEAGVAAAAAALPPSLKHVLLRAHRLEQGWRAEQGQQASGSGLQEEAAEAGWVGRQGGIELIHELLARLAMETAADVAAAGGSPPGSQPDPQQQQQLERQQGPGVLTISTIHAAKGLEWPRVFIPSANQGHIPVQWRPPGGAAWAAGGGRRDVGELQQAHREEERRLCHVAATRAQDRLTISYVQPSPGGKLPESWEEAQNLPRCSSILAGTLRRLRHRPDVVAWDGRLPEEDWPGVFDQDTEEERKLSHTAWPAERQQQQPGADGGTVLSAGSSRGQEGLAARVRAQLAAKGGAVKLGAGAAKQARCRKAPLRPIPT